MSEVDFLEASEERSLAICVESRKLWVSREVLACASPVFKRMLYGEFMEGSSSEIRLPGKSYEEILELVQALIPHPGLKKITDYNVDVLLEFAEEYQLMELRSRCVEFLQRKTRCISADDDSLFSNLLILSAKHQVNEVLCEMLPLAARRSLRWMEENRLFHTLPAHIIATILESKLRKWERFLPEVNPPERKEEAKDPSFLGPYAFVPLGRGHCQCCDNKTHVRSCKRCSASVCVSCSAHACPRCHYPHPADPTTPFSLNRDSRKKVCQSCCREFRIATGLSDSDSCPCDYPLNNSLLTKG